MTVTIRLALCGSALAALGNCSAPERNAGTEPAVSAATLAPGQTRQGSTAPTATTNNSEASMTKPADSAGRPATPPATSPTTKPQPQPSPTQLPAEIDPVLPPVEGDEPAR